MTSARKQLAIVHASVHASVLHISTKTTILLNQSMHVMIVLYPLSSGNSITKLMWIYLHSIFGTDNG